MNEFSIPESLAQEILNYLSSCPYRDVWGLVRGLQALQPKKDGENTEEVPAEPIEIPVTE